MPGLRLFPALLLLSFCASAPVLLAQQDHSDPLTEAQQQAIEEAGIDPAARVDLYTKYINERADRIKGLIPRPESGRGRRIDNELQALSALVDELSSNLDEYGERKADLRKALKPLNDSIARWQGILKELPKDPIYEISRADATESVGDLADQMKQLTTDQEQYFKEHPKSKGQEREEPE